MIKIKSGLPQDLQVGVNGETFTLTGKGVTEVPEELGRAWLAQFAHTGPVADGLIREVKEAKRGRK